VADWSGGMSAGCKPRVQLFADVGTGQWMAAYSELRYHGSSQSATISEIVKRFWPHESVSCKKRYSKYLTSPLPLPLTLPWRLRLNDRMYTRQCSTETKRSSN